MQKNFSELLDEAWQKHLEPKRDTAPTVISLFAGAGGSSLGYSASGFRELLAVEHDKHAVANFKANFPGVPVFAGDIQSLLGEQALGLAGILPGELNILDGSPPCQSFSTVGKRRPDDTRGQLYLEYVRFLRAFKPKFFVLENVPGLLRKAQRHIFEDMLFALSSSGYRVFYCIIDSLSFGSAQCRPRLFVIGARHDLGIEPSFPIGGFVPYSCRQAWAGLDIPSDDLARAYRQVSSRAGSIGAIIERVPEGKHFRYYSEGFKYFSWRRLWMDKPSGTVVRTPASLVHPYEHRVLSNAEAKRLQGFPSAFNFAGGWMSVRAQVGNSVIPAVTMAIGAHIKKLLLSKHEKTK